MRDVVAMHDDWKKHKVVYRVNKLQRQVDRVLEGIGGARNLAHLQSEDAVKLDAKINEVAHQ